MKKLAESQTGFWTVKISAGRGLLISQQQILRRESMKRP